MRKKTAPPPTPGRRKTSPNQTSGLIAKDQKPKRSAKGKYVLDNRSHRTQRGAVRRLPRRS